MTDTQTTKTPYAVVVVFSGWPLAKLCMFLEDELGATQEQIGVIRIDRNQGKETNRTVMLVDRVLLNRAEECGFTSFKRGLDFKMNEYEVRSHNLPKDGYTRNFFISLPKALTAPDAQAQLENKLEVLGRFGLFGKTQPRMKIPLVSRESGEHRGRAFVTFARETSDEVLALARILLHDTRLYTSENEWELMKCFWAKEQEKRTHAKVPTASGSKKVGPKKGRKKAPPKKALKKTASKKAPPKPVTVDALKPGENKWDQPLAPQPLAPQPDTTGPTVDETPAPATTATPTPEKAPETETPTEPSVGLQPLEFPPLNAASK